MRGEETGQLVRTNDGLLGQPEQRLIRWLVERLPSWMTPNRLTSIGMAGAFLTLVGYAGYPFAAELLWLANLGLVIHWFGDSLDGSVARYRRIERPRFGFYLDNGLDIVAQLMLSLGFALSGILSVPLSLFALCAFYMMAQLTLIRAHVSRIFPLAYGPIGTTELRVIFMMLNIAVLAFPPERYELFGLVLTYPEVLSACWIALIFVTFFRTMRNDLRRLAIEEPPFEK